MHISDLLCDRKTDSRSAYFPVARIVNSVEALEKMLDILCRNSPSVVIHLDCNTVIYYRDADMDLILNELAFKANVFDRICKEVYDSPYDKLGIAVKQRI